MFTITLFLSLWTRLLQPALHADASTDKSNTSSSSFDNAITEQVTWSVDRRLTWSDFKGMPDDANPHHALTAANLAVNAGCKNNQYTYEVKCVFLPQQSWTKNKTSEKLLAHEQLHFDLTEVHARQLRQDLQQLTCSNLKGNLSTVVNNAFKKWKAEQDLFDEASRHGLDKEQQQAWAASINERLNKLEAYK
ncbi:DUF922 domain-containing protein [Pontibacter korlensis]|uniref:DUF922 domain-containing protein n=1 Tax=Pontibacter korlensis TaxID=400092 RepID=A0A0E3UYN0_9BACT|nr:DUF922 domain-containing protein [Pontibacter korlensis]AKD04591.1 hypothetical protein PKOR_17685 [Pontibacter korlensis]